MPEMPEMALLLAVLVLSAPPGPTVPDGPTSVEVQWSVLQAAARVSNGRDFVSVATAVCLGTRNGESYFLTANHAVPKGQAHVYEFFTKDSYPKPSRSLTDGDVVVRLPEADLALVKVATGVEPPPVVRVAGPGQRPKRFPFPALSLGCPNASAPLVRTERIAGKSLGRRTDDGFAFFWQMADKPLAGMSGGPLLDAEGRLIGVCSEQKDGTGYFTHLDEVLAGLKRSGYGWLIAPVEPDATRLPKR